MTERNTTKLNWLEQHFPEGLLVDAAWLTRHGYSTSLRSQYVAAGWLEQPVRGVYRRPRGNLSWEQVVVSLQTLLECPVAIGGRPALELQGYAHFLTRAQTEIHLYGHQRPPSWLHKLPLKVRFLYHNNARLFGRDLNSIRLPGLDWNADTGEGARSVLLQAGLTVQPWGQWNWPLILSTPERAVLELLDELPDRESFYQADKLVEGLAGLSPRRLQPLLEDCKSVKVKRLLFFFAERHNHAWFKRLDRDRVNLGKGKRMLVRGGKFDPAYQITFPEDLDAVQ